jgi:hypothetical protein
MKKKSTGGVILSNTISFLVFLILLALANYLKIYIDSAIYAAIINFLVTNLWLSFIIFFTTLIAEIFWTFKLPLNLPAPILSAISSIFIITYIERLWSFINATAITNIYFPADIIYPVVFWIVIAVGYILILVRFGKEKSESGEPEKKPKEKKKSNVEWSDVGEQFKQALYNLGNSLRNACEPKKKR